MADKKTALFIESIPLIEDRPSGVAHTLAGLVAAMAADPRITTKYEIVLVAPKRGLHKLDRWPGLEGCTRKGMPLRMKIINGLIKFHLLPYMDLLLGRGVYLFGNFKNWPLTKRSLSFTYVHDICYALYPQFVSPKNQQFLFKNVPKFIARTDYVITVSESSRREVIDYYHLPEDKVLVLYNGVNGEVYRPHQPEEVTTVKTRYGIEGKYFLFVSNIEPRKNVDRLVEAFKRLPRNYTLVLVGGSGWLNEATFAAIDAANKEGIRIIKPKAFVPDEDVAALMSGAEALVHPALHEGFGMTPLEAMAAGTPVAVADIPAVREVVGDAGIYFDPASVDAIAEAMQLMVAMPDAERNAYRQKGAKRASEFAWASIAKTLANYIESAEAQRVRDKEGQ